MLFGFVRRVCHDCVDHRSRDTMPNCNVNRSKQCVNNFNVFIHEVLDEVIELVKNTKCNNNALPLSMVS